MKKRSYFIVIILLILKSFFLECSEAKRDDSKAQSDQQKIKVNLGTIAIYTGSYSEREKIKNSLKEFLRMEPISTDAHDSPHSSFKFFKLFYVVHYENIDSVKQLLNDHLTKLNISCYISADNIIIERS